MNQYHDDEFPSKSIGKITQKVREAFWNVCALAVERRVFAPFEFLVHHLAVHRKQRLLIRMGSRGCQTSSSWSGFKVRCPGMQEDSHLLVAYILI